MANRPIVPFKKELGHLRGLYAAVQHSFRAVAAQMVADLASGSANAAQSLRLNSAVTYSTRIQTLLNNIDDDYPQTLRDLLLVRMISALEVFLIESIRTVFLARRDLFRADVKVEFQLAELLSSQVSRRFGKRSLVAKLAGCRVAGLTTSFVLYLFALAIDFSTSPVSLDYVRTLHHKRHLIVHRLGRTDAEYRHKFNASRKLIGVDEGEIIDAFQNVAAFAGFVHRRTEEICLAIPPVAAESDVDIVLQLTVQCADVLPAVLRTDFIFAVGDALFSLSDIARNRHVKPDNSHVLFVAGAAGTVDAYMAQIRKAARRGELSIIDTTTVYSKASDASLLSIELLDKIASALPPLPLPLNIHHMIAEHFNLTRGQAWAAIGRVLRDEALSTFIGRLRDE